MLQKLFSQKDVQEAYKNMVWKMEKYDLDNVCFVMVLKGGVFAGFNLIQKLKYVHTECIYGFIGVSSYEEEISPNQNLMLTYPLDLLKEDVEGRVVWIIDDIVDSGATLKFVREKIELLKPKQIKTCCLVSRKKSLCDVCGFVIEDGFIVGCGMGLGEKYRDLPALYKYVKE